jgi:hypothetical protein
MAKEKDSGPKKNKKEFKSEDRFKYIGFEVQSGKIGDHFKSDAEKQSWVEKVLEKRKDHGARLRGDSSFDVPRVAGYEKIVMTVTSVILVLSLFLPWFSGYTEYEVEAAPVAVEEEGVMSDSTVVDSLSSNSLNLTTVDVIETETTPSEIAEGDDLTATEAVDEAVAEETDEASTDEVTAEGENYEMLEKDEKGFASITAIQKRKEIKRDRMAFSAAGAIGRLGSIGGAIFTSGFVLMLTGLLFIIYILLCLGMAGYTLYTIYGIKADPDIHALKIKKVLRLNWIPAVIWIFGLFISFFGAGYSFDTTGLIKQLGTSYGAGTYLGMLSYGFYISLACFIMNAVKGVEI